LSKWCCQGTTPYAISLAIKSLGLLVLSYIHPFGFDWFKPELLFVESYLGIQKWQFILVLTGIVLSLWRNKFLFLSITLLAYQPTTSDEISIPESMALITTHTSVEDKWDKSQHQAQFDAILQTIDRAIADKKRLIVLPESVFPIFLNRSAELLTLLEEKAKSISIVAGALYWDGETPRNSTYIFNNGKIQIANKVLLVPFGEANPLPDFLSDWVNRVFYDNAIDYKADSTVTDYTIDGVTYRNAICFEATSEKLYEKDKNGKQAKNMIVLSNNGWFHPSVESTLQKLLLQYYSKKYDTTIYHSVNMSESYVIQKGKVKISIY
jgi:apolipoprotein N-acyltransferase